MFKECISQHDINHIVSGLSRYFSIWKKLKSYIWDSSNKKKVTELKISIILEEIIYSQIYKGNIAISY